MVVALVAQGGQELNALRAVDHRRVRGRQGVAHKVLQPRTVHHKHIGLLDGPHVTDGERVVVEAGGGLVDQQAYLHILRPLGHRCGEQVDRVGGGQDVKRAVVPRFGGRSTGREQKATQTRSRKDFFHILPLISIKQAIRRVIPTRHIVLYRILPPM